jgi:imidazolonepropionase-like amidohydrolase
VRRVAAILGGLGVVAAVPSCAPPSDDTWALTNVAVVDLDEGVLTPGQTVLIQGELILDVMPAGSRLADDVEEVEGQGRVIIPGLFDMHAHMVGVDPEPNALEGERYLRLGVLGVRDLGAPIDSIRAFLSRSDSILSPRAWFSGPILDSLPRDFEHLFMQVSSVSQASDVVELALNEGWISIKMHDFLPPRIYSAIAEEARRRGIAVVGHIPHLVSLDEVLSAGQRTVEHLGGLTHGVLRECSTTPPLDPEGLRSPTEGGRYRATMRSDYILPLLEGFDEGRCRLVAQRLAQAEVWQVPNLTLWHLYAEATPGFVDTPENRAAFKRLYPTLETIVKVMHEEGVPMMTGSDEVNDGSIHEEMELLVAAGLSPLDALRAATVNPATFLGVAASLGHVSKGRLADFLILDGDPLSDIRNTRRITAIVLGGRLLEIDEGALNTR